MKIFLVFYAIMTAITFVLYGVDKSKAKKGRWRIPEKTLLLFAAPLIQLILVFIYCRFIRPKLEDMLSKDATI